MKNSFGNIFRITTWGESHGRAIGVLIDGCPAGLFINQEKIQEELDRRAGGKSACTTPRKEPDQVEILSGLFEGQTTGHPISMIIWNQDVDSSKYVPIKEMVRPGHANKTYHEKYGLFDWRGGGRASARETACRVMAGAVAKQLLSHFGMTVIAYTKQIHDVRVEKVFTETNEKCPIHCPDQEASEKMQTVIQKAKERGDSVGGVIEFVVQGLPCGLGEPLFEKLEANLAKAMLSIPATKGFEIDEGFLAAKMLGSIHNQAASGTLGGITTGDPITGRVAFKPTSSIQKPQESETLDGKPALFQLPVGSRHDPCVVPRAVPIVEAMVALVLADAVLMNRGSKL